MDVKFHQSFLQRAGSFVLRQRSFQAFGIAISFVHLVHAESVDWTSATTGSVCGGGVTVTASSGGSTGFTDNDDTFDNGDDVDGVIFTPEGIYDSVNISGRAAGSITFSSPVRNPVMHFYQLDGNTLTFTLDVGQSVTLPSSNNGQTAVVGACNTALSGNSVTGCNMAPANQNTGPTSPKDPDATAIGDLEGAGSLHFAGEFTMIAYTSDGIVPGDNTTRWSISMSCILPYDDAGAAHTGIASVPISNVTADDISPGGTVDLDPMTGNATISEVGSWPSGFSLDTSTGALNYDGTALSLGDHTFEYELCDSNLPADCQTATITITITQGPILNITKNATIIDVLSNGGYAIPGNEIEYTFALENTGGEVDNNTLIITDKLPEGLTLFTGDLDGAGNPVTFADSSAPSSGLMCCSSSHVSFSDEITGTPIFDYIPVASYDPSVTHIRIAPDGAMRDGQLSTASVEFAFRARVD